MARRQRDVETEQRDRDKGTKKAAVRRQRIERQKTETRQRQTMRETEMEQCKSPTPSLLFPMAR